MLDQLAVAEGHELARHVHRHVDLRLLGVGAEVRRHHHARVLDQALDEIGDTGGSSLQTSTAAPATCPDVERGQQIGLVDDAAARAVDDARARLHGGDLARADHVLGLVGQRHVDGEDVGAAEHRLQVREPHAEVAGAALRDERIVHEDAPCRRRLQARGHPRAHLAEAEHARGLPEELGAVDGAIPLEALERVVGQRDLADQRQQHAHGVLGRRDHVAVGGVDDHHALARAGVDVDVVDADAGPARGCAAGAPGRGTRRSPRSTSA